MKGELYKQIFKYILISSFILITIYGLNYFIEVYRLAKAVKITTEESFEMHKKFMYSISFVGVVIDKKSCKKCEINKYQIEIQLKKLSIKEIPFMLQSYQPYYQFIGDTLLISVHKELYDKVRLGCKIMKFKNTIITFDQQKYHLLNEKYNKWLP